MNCEDCNTCPICIDGYLKKKKINYPTYYQDYISNLKEKGIDNKEISHDEAKKIYKKNKDSKEFNDNKYNFDNKIKIKCYYTNCKSNCSHDKCDKQYHLCRGCYIKYLKNELEPKCPNCTQIWSYEFITSFMTEKFMKTEWRQIVIEKYKKSEEKFMSSTQKMLNFINLVNKEREDIEKNHIKIIDYRKNMYKYYKNYIDKCNCGCFKYYENIFIYKDIITFDNCKCINIEEKNTLIIQKYNHEIKYEKLLVLIYKINNNCNKVISNYMYKLEIRDYLNENNNNIYIKNCQNKNCNGYLSDNWICSLCNTETCSICYECKENKDHKCNPDIIKTNKLIQQDSKPCPQCQTMIFKINGCNHMYCTICKTKYDWKTNRLIRSSHFHNPELQRERRNIGNVLRLNNDFICGGVPNKNLLISTKLLTKKFIDSLITYKDIDDKYKNIIIISSIIIDAFLKFSNDYEVNLHLNLNTDRNNFHTHEKLRIQKLKNKITEKEWINKLCIREKNIDKKKTSNLYLRELYYAVSDILRNCEAIEDKYFDINFCLNDIDTHKLLYSNAISLISLYDIYNDIFYNKIHKIYGGVYYNILFKRYNNIKKYNYYRIDLNEVKNSIKFINTFKKYISLDNLYYDKKNLNTPNLKKIQSIKNELIDNYVSFKFN